MSMAEKVKKMNFSSPGAEHEPNPEQLHQEVRRDMGKVALFIAALAVVLMVVFYFVLNHNISVLQNTVAEFNAVDDQVASLGSTVNDLEGTVAGLDTALEGLQARIAGLENLPQETRNMIYASLLDDISQRASFMSEQLQGEDQQQLQQALGLIRQVREGIGRTN